ncbi:hypothetical protein FQA39_LY12054 [Lamprigera yunnana]|nr:hypothetical protein FQA39_LY12054 [Lamprigera yunnana]
MVEKNIGNVDAPKRSHTRNVYYAEESDSDENDPFHDNDDDRDGCYIPEIDCSEEEPENEVEVAIAIDKEDDVEDALNELGSGVEDLSVECDAVIDEATATPIDRRPRLREIQEGPLRGKKVPAHLFPPDIEPEHKKPTDPDPTTPTITELPWTLLALRYFAIMLRRPSIFTITTCS